MTPELELELRQLAGVLFVSFGRRDAATVVELAVDDAANPEWLRSEARRITLGHMDGPVVIDVVGDGGFLVGSASDRRVRLMVTDPPGPGMGVEVHLSCQERHVTIEASAGDPATVVLGVIAGLRRLGFVVGYELVGVHDLPDEAGPGTLVMLLDPGTGTRRWGVATGRDEAEATARAVLDALNRVLPVVPAHGHPS